MPKKHVATPIERIIERVVEYAGQKLSPPQLAPVQLFLQQYYQDVAADEISDRSEIDLYGAALMHWRLLAQHPANSAQVRVYNPQFEEHGWQSTHTIAEIVHDDMPFLVDTVTMTLNRLGQTLHLTIHPVISIRRDGNGQLLTVDGDCRHTGAQPGSSGRAEALIHLEIDRQTEPEMLERIRAALAQGLADMRAAVEDWPAMTERLRGIIKQGAPSIHEAELQESTAFLEWLADDHFALLGARDYFLSADEQGHEHLKIQPGSGLGILREKPGQTESSGFSALPARLRRLAHQPHWLLLTKTNARSTVHRSGYLDYVGLRLFDEHGKVIGERRFLGLYTSTAYSANPRQIPLLRKKIERVIEKSGVKANSHKARALLNVLDNYLRDELLEIQDDVLLTIAQGIVQLQERQRVRLFVREDHFQRYVSCLVFCPRDNYTTEVRVKMQRILMEAFGGVAAEFNVSLTDSLLARVHFMIRIPHGKLPEYQIDEIQAQVAAAIRRWEDDLQQALLEHFGEEHGNDLLRRYGTAFPAGYREDFIARTAVGDIQRLETLTQPDSLAMALYAPLEAGPGELHFKLFRRGQPVGLSSSLPMLENMGVDVLDEHPYRIEPAHDDTLWISDFGLRVPPDVPLDGEDIRELFQEAFLRAYHRDTENDGFNRLVLKAGLNWREIVVLRALCRYLGQIGMGFTPAYIAQCLVNNAGITRLLVELFLLRHNPEARDPAAAQAKVDDIGRALDRVANLDEDRILRRYLTLVQASLRTNYFQRDGAGQIKPYLSIKLDPQQIPGLPEPRPMFEIFVYSPRVEGVHLRGGKVARGGLRWSDRREDFRTEVLGLVKAQMVKNAVIVPGGSKGGFYPKQLPPPSDREAWLAEGVASYRTFIRGLLDLTDNLVSGQIVPPSGVVRHDADDPYLVVAADKGTATFSDIANAVARDYGFWLDDAFASGGSAGYDHKKMGITARGAWESAKRHARGLGFDTQSQNFTVVGIGDMAGDVFGNGMLLSRHICLVAAFNHAHIFIDPQPDPEASFGERERLFALPRSTWADYRAELISAGGGIWPRSAKSIPLSAQARAILNIADEALTPSDLIRAILKAPVDLIYNGGIGTYVKASQQIHTDANDRTNDALRVDGRDLRCKMVVEGGNLGFTQLGRIEYAQRGGRIFTDAIDNSAGVDCSDHEVNLKILLNAVVGAGDMTSKQRNELLAELTPEVSALVLRDNYLQTQALSVSAALADDMQDAHARFIHGLERAGKLNRALEFLPSEEELMERKVARRGLTLPELAVLLAYAKNTLYPELLASSLPDDPSLTPVLHGYFPPRITSRFADHLGRHYLRREIICNQITNAIVNRTGNTFVHRLSEETGATAADIARAWIVATKVFDVPQLWHDIEALDNQVPGATQIRMFLEARKLVERATRWMLRNARPLVDLDGAVERYRAGVAELTAAINQCASGRERNRCEKLAQEMIDAGVPAALASHIGAMDLGLSGLDIVDVARQNQASIETVARLYFGLGERLQLDWLRDAINRLPRNNRWLALARASLRDDLYRQQRSLTSLVLARISSGEDPQDSWCQEHRVAIERCNSVFNELQTHETQDLAMLSAALREIKNHLM